MTDLPRENVQHYPRPPRLEPVEHKLSVLLQGLPVAQTTEGWRVLETHHAPTYYFPPDDVETALLQDTGGGSFCEWKGQAQYFDLISGTTRLRRVCWTYRAPTSSFGQIKDHIAFYAGALDCFVGGIAVIPQPGGFYGGWITPNLDGIVKGAPGTQGW